MGQLHSTRLWPHRPLLKDPSISQALLQPLIAGCYVIGNHGNQTVTHSLFHKNCIILNKFTLFKSQHYNTPAPTCFWPHWPIIKEDTAVQNSRSTFVTCSRAAEKPLNIKYM